MTNEDLKNKFFDYYNSRHAIPTDNVWNWIESNILQKQQEANINNIWSNTKPMEGKELEVLNETLKKSLSDKPTTLIDKQQEGNLICVQTGLPCGVPCFDKCPLYNN